MKIRFIYLLSLLLAFSFSCKNDNSNQEVSQTTEIRQWKPEDTRSITAVTAKRGLITKTDKTTPGYVLFQSSSSTKTNLIDMDGNVVHTWQNELSSLHSYLLENGHLFRLERDVDFPTFAAGGQAGRIREYDWDGNLIWDFEYANANELTHHDFEIMPNGNILAIAYEVKTPEEAAAAGRNPEITAKAGIWPDKIIEIKPIRPNGGEIVWEWHMWDHLVQDFDPTKKNYGVLADNPRKININLEGGEGGPEMTEEQVKQMIQMGFTTSNATVDNQTSDISHFNAISYHAELDQIIVSCPNYGEIFIIDHGTTIEEAKGSAGGKWGHGGDLLYRWGNPKNYGRGTKEDQRLFGQHDSRFISKGLPGEGRLMVFNNDIVNPENKMPSIWAAIMAAQSPDPQVSIADLGNYSAVYELVPPTDENGAYIIPESGPIGPIEPIWEYLAPDKYSLYSAFVSGAHRMKNGNTFVTEGATGRFIEVTQEGEIVWEYMNPYNEQYRLPDGTAAQPTGPFLYAQFRGTHIDKDFPAFKGKDLKPIEPQPEPFIFKMPPPPPVQ
jgi:hypothetical protein